ncbi:amidohydrolase family protein [Cnuibacter physcomitrellae]|uniref:N-acetylglucosamine-6-phosphate deacetylase n=1 Tax=Cnuibacter physcomitrellae TaxID=1619308 RepID=UPI002175E983|nr:amidohydrolase family protein [Cnuibacter physcomitrellae]MCS5497240.1 amidohydrolase family protein [Cnuibacter physcomitrellae]
MSRGTRVFEGRSADAAEIVRVEVADGVITAVSCHPSRDESFPVLAPGLVDTQVNGYAGLDVNGDDVTPSTLAALTARLRAVGVTTWVPTVITGPEERILHALDCIRRARDADPRVRDAIPCAHIEGPFISPDDGARGVHDIESIRPLDAEEVERWRRAGPVGIVTVSPHDDHSAEHIARVTRAGITVAIGHTSADHAHILAAVDAGARLATHLGNGIPTMLPRHPNPIWSLLADERVTAGLIADGHHLPDETLVAMIRAKGERGAFLVSDLTAIGGLPVGSHTTPVGGQVVLSEDLRLSHAGSDLLAGAAATLTDGVRRLARLPAIGLGRALRLASENPVRIVPGGRPGLGRLEPGGPADLVVLSGDGLDVDDVFVGGVAVA